MRKIWYTTEETYTHLFKSMKARGLKRAGLVISDAHAGLQKAISKNFLGSSWQRCKVHLMRNVLAKIKGSDKGKAAECLSQIWRESDIEGAKDQANKFIDRYGKRYPQAIEVLAEGLEDSLQFYAYEELDHRKTSSTNILERLNKEAKRRSRVVGVFPSQESFVRLMVSYLMEYSEDWPSMKAYMSPEKLEQFRTKRTVA